MKVEYMNHEEEEKHSTEADTRMTQIIITVIYVQVGGRRNEHVNQRYRRCHKNPKSYRYEVKYLKNKIVENNIKLTLLEDKFGGDIVRQTIKIETQKKD